MYSSYKYRSYDFAWAIRGFPAFLKSQSNGSPYNCVFTDHFSSCYVKYTTYRRTFRIKIFRLTYPFLYVENLGINDWISFQLRVTQMKFALTVYCGSIIPNLIYKHSVILELKHGWIDGQSRLWLYASVSCTAKSNIKMFREDQTNTPIVLVYSSTNLCTTFKGNRDKRCIFI